MMESGHLKGSADAGVMQYLVSKASLESDGADTNACKRTTIQGKTKNEKCPEN